MLYSRSHNFVFVHIAKSAGLSVRRVLDPYGVPFSRRKLDAVLSVLPVRREAERIYLRGHSRADWIRTRLGADIFDTAYTFAFFRNPYDRALSRYLNIRDNPTHHRHRDALAHDFAGFLRLEQKRGHLRRDSQWRQVTSATGEVLVKHLYRFETLETDFRKVLDDLGIPHSGGLPRINASARTGYRDYYDAESRRIVEEEWRVDLDRLGYSF